MPASRAREVVFAAALALAAWPGSARALPTGFLLDSVRTGLAQPVALRFAPDGRLFWIERTTGRVMVLPASLAGTASVWATVPVAADGERGLLGLALHPAFPDSPFVYLYHSNPAPLANRIVRLTDSSGVGVHYTVLRDGLVSLNAYHQSGRIAFGGDGDLYLTSGDQERPENAQVAASIRGKLLHFSSLGEPVPCAALGATNGVCALGIRNAFGLCFDPASGTGYFTENGTDCRDKLNVVASGADYGWSAADSCNAHPNETTAPIWSITPTIAPTGCVVYRASAWPEYDGDLFMGSFNDGAVRRVHFVAGSRTLVDSVEVFAVVPGGNVLDLAVGPRGDLFFSTLDAIWRISRPGALAVTPDAARPLLRAWPSPSSGVIHFTMPGGAAPARAVMFDAGGRQIRRWSGPLGASLDWDGRDGRGRFTPPGVYLLRVEESGHVSTARAVRMPE